ncbi:CMRF35-like molecule 2 [Heterodontus francisci]|uniref:CMRF35-like molecule 2 n=1 Tax=Heterodontus francisci TaxID=7792 RepID=UPI00355AE717
MQHFLIVLICFLPVSGALWAEENATGVVGRTVTIYCYYDKQRYESYRKYWCHKWYRTSCTTVVDTNMQIGWQGRVSIKDYTTQGIFAVTMKNLTSADTGCCTHPGKWRVFHHTADSYFVDGRQALGSQEFLLGPILLMPLLLSMIGISL